MSTSALKTGATVAGVLVITMLWLGLTLGLRPLTNPDEGRYVGVAWEMVRTGQWLVPNLNGLPYFHKPPLFYWITAVAISLFGPNEWAARAASLLAASMIVVALFFFIDRWRGRARAITTSLVFVAMPMLLVAAQFANHDMLVASLISCAILSFAHYVLTATGPTPLTAQKRYLALGYLLCALGVLSKGLIGIVLPAMVITVWILASKNVRIVPCLLWSPAIALFFVVSAPWFISMSQLHVGFLDYFVLEQHVKRFTSSGFNNPQPVWFFPIVLIVLNIPWTIWLFVKPRQIITDGSFQTTPEPGPLSDSEKNKRDVSCLMWVWVLSIVFFFSIPSSKLIGYVLPVLAPLAFLIASRFDAVTPLRQFSRPFKASFLVSVVITYAVIGAVSLKYEKTTKSIGEYVGQLNRADIPVYFLNQYFFDFPFYSEREAPVFVVDNWHTLIGNRHQPMADNWKKELADATRFADSDAAQRLLDVSEFDASVASAGEALIISNNTTSLTYCLLKNVKPVVRSPRFSLWHLPPGHSNRASCAAQTPRTGLADKSTTPPPASPEPKPASTLAQPTAARTGSPRH